MDLKNLLVQSDRQPSAAAPQANTEEPKPELKKRYSSISDLVNNDDAQSHSSSPLAHVMNSPVMHKQAIPQSATQTPGTLKLDDIKARNSISSLTNDTDVDVDGKETPSIARRLSYEISTSESNSPVIPKKTITRAPSLQDMINVDEPIEFEEPVYDEDPSASASKAASSNKKAAASVSIPPSKQSPNDMEKGLSSPKQAKKTRKRSGTPKKEHPAPPKPKNIEDEINELDKIEKGVEETSAKGNKPRRYHKPPIWAQKYTPVVKQGRSAGRAKRSGSSARDVSITGLQPHNDFTRRVTNWVYAQIVGVPKDQRQFLELEIKFGRIWHKQTDRRILVPVTNECIVDDGYILDCRYKAGMEKGHYDRVKKYVTGLTRLHKEKFKTLRSDQIDRTYREVTGGQVPKFIRLTTDKSTGRIVASIQKKKLGSLFVHSPDLLFDYRLSMSIEVPNHDNPERFQNQTPENERHKKRTSFFHPSTATRIDMTDVVSKERGRSTGEETHELELEIDMDQLLEAFDNLENDSFTFEELSETIMDNARIINRELAKPQPK